MSEAMQAVRSQNKQHYKYVGVDKNKYCPECKESKHVSAFYAGDSWCRQCRRHHSNKIWNGETTLTAKRPRLSYKDRKQIEQNETIAVKQKIQRMHTFITQVIANDNAEVSIVSKQQKRKQELVQHGDHWIWI